MNWKGCGRKQSWPNLRYYPSIYLEELRQTIKNLGHDRWSLDRDLKPVPPEYEGVFTTEPRYSTYLVLDLVSMVTGSESCCVAWLILLLEVFVL
jgi:hypothetical protein